MRRKREGEKGEGEMELINLGKSLDPNVIKGSLFDFGGKQT